MDPELSEHAPRTKSARGEFLHSLQDGFSQVRRFVRKEQRWIAGLAQLRNKRADRKQASQAC